MQNQTTNPPLPIWGLPEQTSRESSHILRLDDNGQHRAKGIIRMKDKHLPVAKLHSAILDMTQVFELEPPHKPASDPSVFALLRGIICDGKNQAAEIALVAITILQLTLWYELIRAVTIGALVDITSTHDHIN